MSRFTAVICGAGIAGAEAALRLHRLAGDDVEITFVDPGEQLAYRPLAVREPFALSGVRRYPIADIAASIGARWVQDGVESVDHDARKVLTSGGAQLEYDALLIALGGRREAPYEGAQMFTDANAAETFHGIVQDIEAGYISSVAFVEPAGPTWPLPLYELALMTAERAFSMGATVQITFVTPHARPLLTFGDGAADAVGGLFGDAHITLHAGASVRVTGARQLAIGDLELRPERIVTLPLIAGPGIDGIPASPPHGQVPIDGHCRVLDSDGRLFAAGDATDFPIKHGGIGARQADTAAAGIAHLAGVGPEPGPFEPVLRGMLMTGGKPLYLLAHIGPDRAWQSEIYDEPPWPADEKVVAEELGAYLRDLGGDQPRS